MEPRTNPIALWAGEKDGHTITCLVRSWPNGTDVRLTLDGEVCQTQQCRDLEEWLPLTDRWWHVL